MRKTITLSTLSVLLLSTASQAQLVTITGPDGQVVNSTEIQVDGNPGASAVDIGLTTTLNGETPKTVNLVRYETEMVHGSQNYFCWGECWAPQLSGARPTWYAMTPVDMEPGMAGGGFHAYWSPMGIAACTKFRFVWYDVANEDDSVWVDIRFCSVEGLGLNNVSAPAFSMFPNPSVGGTVQFELERITGATARMVVYDVLGGRVVNQRLAKGQGRLDLSTEALSPGVYFATLEENGRAVMTKRLVVQR